MDIITLTDKQKNTLTNFMESHKNKIDSGLVEDLTEQLQQSTFKAGFIETVLNDFITNNFIDYDETITGFFREGLKIIIELERLYQITDKISINYFIKISSRDYDENYFDYDINIKE